MCAEADAGTPGSLTDVLGDVTRERAAQDALWGVQEFPDGTGTEYAADAERAKAACRTAWSEGELTWRHILTEEFLEALAESDPERLRAELVQTAAVAVKWVQALDRRPPGAPHPAGESGGGAEKLVRDRIPEIIEASGRSPRVRVAGDDEYAALLRAKMYEEAGEYAAGATGPAESDPEELADLLEVVHALARTHGLDPAALEELRAAKSAERGGFTRRLVLRLPEPGDGKKASPASPASTSAPGDEG
ncbi:nucleoside triphosphate pyrophosphohydrolase [Actinomadura sp. HBU206391]|uniref:nucleoside triphosphate pyrophosphohydrolase n=1 Tax=Actinomadura sp. HBU206391 TaxID=2731692 RepID=UPI001C9D1D13|nr:nucleoside triphosphate pyrophosphohydrolase [Actinomadura sp. HBU206391]